MERGRGWVFKSLHLHFTSVYGPRISGMEKDYLFPSKETLISGNGKTVINMDEASRNGRKKVILMTENGRMMRGTVLVLISGDRRVQNMKDLGKKAKSLEGEPMSTRVEIVPIQANGRTLSTMGKES